MTLSKLMKTISSDINLRETDTLKPFVVAVILTSKNNFAIFKIRSKFHCQYVSNS